MMSDPQSGELNLQPSKLQIPAMDFPPFSLSGMPDPRSDLSFPTDGMYDFGIPDIRSASPMMNNDGGPLTPYIGGTSGDRVYVSSGILTNGLNSSSIPVIPNIGGTQLDVDPPPYLTISTGVKYLFLKLQFKPSTKTFATGYYAMTFKIKEIVNAQFILDASADQTANDVNPIINSATGSVSTNATIHILWAQITKAVGQSAVINFTKGRGNATLLFHPPNELIVFQS